MRTIDANQLLKNIMEKIPYANPVNQTYYTEDIYRAIRNAPSTPLHHTTTKED